MPASAGHAGHDLCIPFSAATPQGWTERWYSATPVHADRLEGVSWRQTEEVVWGCMRIALPAREPCARAVYAAYMRLFAVLQKTRHPHLWRIWNFIPRINQPNAAGLETYRDFNMGRAQAFAQACDHGLAQMPWAMRYMPAATGIGCQGDEILVHFLAGRIPGRHVENPYQVAAYHYPAEHGPRPPCFARASRIGLGGVPLLFLSGTASIMGHRTVHEGDVERQTETAIRHLQWLGMRTGQPLDARGVFKVYVRHARDLARVQATCARLLPAGATTAFLVTDICRANLLVEIEGVQP